MRVTSTVNLNFHINRLNARFAEQLSIHAMSTTWDNEKGLQHEHRRGVKHATTESNPPRWNWVKLNVALTLLFCSLCAWSYTGSRERAIWGSGSLMGAAGEDLCPQQQPIVPQRHKNIIDDLNKRFSSDAFEKEAVKLLGDAVRIP